MKIYLAATYSKYPIMQQIADRLRRMGYQITSRWIEGHSKGIDNSEDAIQNYHDLMSAETLVFFSDKREEEEHKTLGGRHTEFGIAIAKGMRIILVGERENVFHHLSGVEVVEDVDKLFNLLTL